MSDFKAHFPEFDEFLHLLVMSRFAPDRKNAYLWLWCDSDWGKSFLLNVLDRLGIVVKTSAKEIEAAFEGKPVGRRPVEFKRALVLAVEEFKAVKSELKQLESEMQLAPKNELTATVELFTKLFTSAESVDSLTTDAGVEDQFANRFSLLRGQGKLNDREAFGRIGSASYFDAILHYTAATLNDLIVDRQTRGRIVAANEAQAWLNAFHDRHNVSAEQGTITSNLESIAEDALRWCEGNQHRPELRDKFRQGDDGEWHMTCAGSVLSRFIDECIDRPARVTVRRRKDDLMKAMSGDGRGYGTHRIDGKPVLSVLLATLPQSKPPY